MRKTSFVRTAWILVSYAGVALLQAWPLPLHLASHLTGPPGGDTGVYVWNTWVFRHELFDVHRSPFWTDTILPLNGPTDLSLHNYTVFADLLALTIRPWLGVVAAFNVVYLINVALAGFGMFLLARRVTGRPMESWLAGILFGCSPFLVARGAAHFSLAAAAPLPFFAYWFDRAWSSCRRRDALAAGTMVAWATFSDPYYGIYCGMLAAVVCLSGLFEVRVERTPDVSRRSRRLSDGAIIASVCLVGLIAASGGGEVRLARFALSVHSLYTPVLIATVAILGRLAMAWCPSVSWRRPPLWRTRGRVVAIAVATATVLLAPLLYAIAERAIDGRLVVAPVRWRSSAPGVDLVSLVLPNPNHPFAPRAVVHWLEGRPGRYEENVASFSIVALGVIVSAWRLARFRPRRLWTAVTIGFASLALGPFVEIGGMHTFVPTPWTLLRYVPIVGEARMPARFAIMALVGFSVIFASALTALGARFPHARGKILAAVGLALACELVPAPRPLFSAAIPAVYQTIAADPRPVRVMDLPLGVRDGLSSIGDFTAASEYYQTLHGKPLIGGYLSRVDQADKDYLVNLPVPHALMILSEGRTPTADTLGRAEASADEFVADAKLGYVVVDTSRASPALRSFAIHALHLRPVGRSGAFELYAPRERASALTTTP